MGCTFAHLRHRGDSSPANVFKVFNVDKEGVYRNPGKIEITNCELIFHHKNKEPIRWPLRYLRRYGYDLELFSFESGRRCPTGPGIYAFKCSKAESLFNIMQDCIQRAGHSDDGTARPVAMLPEPATATTMSVAETQTGSGDINGRLVTASTTFHPVVNHLSSPPSAAHASSNGVIALQAFPQISNGQHEYFNSETPHFNAVGGASFGDGARSSNFDLSRQVSLQSEPDVQIQYAQLDLGHGGDTATAEDHDTGSQSYMNMPKPSVGMSLSSSVPLIEAPPLPPLLEEDDTATEEAVNYLNLDFKKSEQAPPLLSNGVRALSNGNVVYNNKRVGDTAAVAPEDTSKGEGYAVIDFNKTAAISATMSTKQLPEEEEGGRKTRHNSNSQHPLSM